MSTATRYQVQQYRNGQFVCNCGSPHTTREAAQQACDGHARDDWERSGVITPSTHYVVAEVQA